MKVLPKGEVRLVTVSEKNNSIFSTLTWFSKVKTEFEKKKEKDKKNI